MHITMTANINCKCLKTEMLHCLQDLDFCVFGAKLTFDKYTKLSCCKHISLIFGKNYVSRKPQRKMSFLEKKLIRHSRIRRAVFMNLQTFKYGAWKCISSCCRYCWSCNMQSYVLDLMLLIYVVHLLIYAKLTVICGWILFMNV